jgi:hypothetical protein
MSDEPDDIQEELQMVYDVTMARTFEVIDYTAMVARQQLFQYGKQVAIEAYRSIVRAVREQADSFESEVINDDEFWDGFENSPDQDEDEDDDLPYWGGSNEWN